jgi:hypothetical protein
LAADVDAEPRVTQLNTGMGFVDFLTAGSIAEDKLFYEVVFIDAQGSEPRNDGVERVFGSEFWSRLAHRFRFLILRRSDML